MVRRLFFIVLLLTSLRGIGQSSIGIDTSSFSFTFTDTVNLQTPTFAASVRLINTGLLTITDSIDVIVAVDSGNAVLHNFFTVTDTSTMIPGDTTTWNLNSAPNAALRSGINTVVIWPKAYSPTTGTSDSLFLIVYVDTTGLGVYFHYTPKGFLMYPNPGHDVLNFKSFTTSSAYKKIRLYDSDGRLAMVAEFAEQIDVAALRQGIYIVSVESASGDYIKFRYIKE